MVGLLIAPQPQPNGKKRARCIQASSGDRVFLELRNRLEPSSLNASRTMRSNRATDSLSEVLVRRALYARGLRYRKNHRIGISVRTNADIVFSRARVAVFVDGCFWHACPAHGDLPVSNRDFWRAKFDRNRARDRRVNDSLRNEGWHVIRIWEHEDVAEAVLRVEQAVGQRSVQDGSRRD